MRVTGSATGFLGHIERCAVLLHLVDVTAEDPGRCLSGRAQGAQGLFGGAGGQARDHRLQQDRPHRRGRTCREDRQPSSGGCARRRWRCRAATRKGVEAAMKKLLETIREEPQRRASAAGRPASRSKRDGSREHRASPSARRIVVKIGSALLVDAASGAIKSHWLAAAHRRPRRLARRAVRRSSPFHRAPSRLAGGRWALRMAI